MPKIVVGFDSIMFYDFNPKTEKEFEKRKSQIESSWHLRYVNTQSQSEVSTGFMFLMSKLSSICSRLFECGNADLAYTLNNMCFRVATNSP